MSDARQITVSIMYFSVILSGMLVFTGAFFTAYDVQSSNENLNELNKQLGQNVEGTGSAIEDDARNIDNGIEAGLFYLRGAFNALKTILGLFTAIPSIAGTIISSLTLPQWVGGFITIALTYGYITIVYEGRRN